MKESLWARSRSTYSAKEEVIFKLSSWATAKLVARVWAALARVYSFVIVGSLNVGCVGSELHLASSDNDDTIKAHTFASSSLRPFWSFA
jgi:hypothetical protein